MGGFFNQADILPVVDSMLIFIEWCQVCRRVGCREKVDAFHYDVCFLLGKSPFHRYGNQFRLGLRLFGITTPDH